MSRFARKLLFVLAGAIILYGCAPKNPHSDIVWPEPPDQPRIKYVKTHRGTADFSKGGVAASLILGEASGTNLSKPMGVHVDRHGKVFVTDTARSDVFVFDTKNSKVYTLGDMGIKMFYKPISIVTDDSDRMFVSDSQLDTVTALAPDGKVIQTLRPEVPFQQPTGLAVDNNKKRLYVIDTHTHDIRVFDLETLKHIDTIGKRGKEEGEFNFPSYIAVDQTTSNIYVVDTMNGRVQIFDSEGKFIRAFGQFGDSPGMFARPRGVAVSSEGHLYVVDAAFNNVQIFNTEGRILLGFSGYGSGRGAMILPAGIAIDNEDYIYVVDSWNSRVTVFEFLGEKSKAREAAAAQSKKKK
ncbi:MAG: 6-bladed beta-propeller [Deltaproteobacteria bacterium]|nr:6-bladed beta-propeller [Deltaproteobacteria bacterium]MBZ0220068.1 6-bladed beta-propeller [Deltaproteobacteria bacterium]